MTSNEIHIYVISNFKRTDSALFDARFLAVAGFYTDLNRESFFKNEYGKPLINGVHFSLAHSANILVAVFSKTEVGVDIEQVRMRKYHKNIAQKYGFLGASLEEFLREWVAREAFIKLLGTSLAKDLANIRLSPDFKRVYNKTSKAFISYFQPSAGFIAAICSNCPKDHKIFFI